MPYTVRRSQSQVDAVRVYGVAIPTQMGLRTALNALGAQKGELYLLIVCGVADCPGNPNSLSQGKRAT